MERQATPASPVTSGGLPLDGVRIVDFTVVWAGPFAAQILAEWGAEVIRVESTKYFQPSTRGTMAHPPKALIDSGALRGYPDREPGDRPWNRWAGFNVHSRNKLSMTVDLNTEDGQEVLERLIRTSDGLIENNAVASMDRVGVTWERLSKINPELVMVRMPAFGLTGPYRNYRTFGNHMEALVGHYSLFGYAGASPADSGLNIMADPAGGAAGAMAFMAGMLQRRRTGKGVQIEVATADGFANYLGDYVLDYGMNGRLHEYRGNRDSAFAPQGVYPCMGDDRWVSITIGSTDQWKALCGAMNRADLAGDARYQEADGRRRFHDELDAEISAWTSGVDATEVMNSLQGLGVPAGVVMNEADAYGDPHLNARGYWEELEHPETGTHRYPGVVWKAEETPNRLRRAAPRLGEDNEYVYRDLLRYTDDEYRRLEGLGHIGMDYDPSIP